MLKKEVYLKFVFLFMIFILSCTYVFADDLEPLDDEFDIAQEIENINSMEASSSTSSLPTINSRAYVVIDRKSSNVIIGKNENQKKKMASTTKIMTALIVIDNCNLSDTVTISKKAAGTGGSRLGLKTGDKITINDLLYGLMLRSGNDAAVALAEHTSGSISDFATLMNDKAIQLGLENTHFVTPHGLDQDEHYTTAYELALLTNYALNNKTFSKIVGTKNYTININGYSKALNNTNELLGSLNGVYGVKTGFTNGANRCLVTSCKRGDMDVICVVLGADTKKFRTQDSIKLINYTFDNFSYVNINEKIENHFNDWLKQNINNFDIYKGLNNNVDLYYEQLECPFSPIRNDLIDNINITIDCETNLTAPLFQDDVIGSIVVYLDNDILYNIDIKLKTNLKKKTVFNYMIEFLRKISQLY